MLPHKLEECLKPLEKDPIAIIERYENLRNWELGNVQPNMLYRAIINTNYGQKNLSLKVIQQALDRSCSDKAKREAAQAKKAAELGSSVRLEVTCDKNLPRILGKDDGKAQGKGLRRTEN